MVTSYIQMFKVHRIFVFQIVAAFKAIGCVSALAGIMDSSAAEELLCKDVTMARSLSTKLRQIAKEELNEDPSRSEEDLEHIEEWLNTQLHLKARKDRWNLLNFLRATKFSLQQAKEKIDYFYSIKSLIPEQRNKDPKSPELELIIKSGALVPVTKTETESPFPTVVIIDWKKTDPEEMPYENLLKVFLMYLDILLKENEHFSVCGAYFLYDMKEFPLGYIKQLTPSLCMRVVTLIQNAYPYKIRGLIFINTPKVYETFINAFWPFMNEEIKRKVKTFNEHEMEKLYDIIPKEALPKDYGGTASSLAEITDEWHQVLINHRNWFLEENKYFSDKPKTIEEDPFSSSVFKDLNID